MFVFPTLVPSKSISFTSLQQSSPYVSGSLLLFFCLFMQFHLSVHISCSSCLLLNREGVLLLLLEFHQLVLNVMPLTRAYSDCSLFDVCCKFKVHICCL